MKLEKSTINNVESHAEKIDLARAEKLVSWFLNGTRWPLKSAEGYRV